MEKLTEDKLGYLENRHFRFEDCLIERVELTFTRGLSSRHVKVEIEARDGHSSDGWGRVILEFRGVDLLHVLEDRTTNVVLGGIEWKSTELGWIADFSPAHSDDVVSTFIIEAQEVWFESMPYTQSAQMSP